MKLAAIALCCTFFLFGWILVKHQQTRVFYEELDRAVANLELSEARLRKSVLRSWSGLDLSYDALTDSILTLNQSHSVVGEALNTGLAPPDLAAISEDMSSYGATLEHYLDQGEQFKRFHSVLRNAERIIPTTAARALDQEYESLGGDRRRLLVDLVRVSELNAEALDQIALRLAKAEGSSDRALSAHVRVGKAHRAECQRILEIFGSGDLERARVQLEAAYHGILERSGRRAAYVNASLFALAIALGVLACVFFRRDLRSTKALRALNQDLEAQVTTQAAALAEAHKLEAIGQLAAGVAHEINTPCQYVRDNTTFVRESFDPIGKVCETAQRATEREDVEELRSAIEAADLDFLFSEIPRALQEAEEGTMRIGEIVKALKEFSHPGTKERVAVDLNRVIFNAATVSRNEWKHVAELRMELDDGIPRISGYAAELGQVFLNLIVNSAQAIAETAGEGGNIEVSSEVSEDTVLACVRDNGPGIPEEIRSRIFEPFFTTKEVGKGSGQGLAIARSIIVDKHGGTISAKSRASGGTEFRIHLPLSSAANQEPPP